ncbi:Phosphopantetheine adenylyltransferase [Caminicella sporogenes DSM 14501]|uniref:Phosphopantetheine adenylyltransferase n=1 Tax=Caminicella sporogenes DSM 14501 TaxID=1121266 RepID=A0A1M6LGI9_9FIRM|nr:pantetheine-phosphate adenylyltransferase [Caminicella sporogenes]RKD27825.1 pantetheine-phosphate adenylyltransferase [Caminicella sporogenes]WIF94600.1 pantetheine-phosphate adenylyltransferase [Caminicella sporogenes]SHJ70299.1 Phosphopantetheine adenylyltransferase [Caminicella sporogenes DSM 14501]
MKIAVYPGSFDPITNGHLDIIKRSAKIFDKLVVAVLNNPNKKPIFNLDERVEMIKEATKDLNNVKIDYFSGLLIDYMNNINANIIVKGLRAISDFEYEFQMALMNRKLNENIETIFMMTNSEYSYLSSSLIKEVYKFGGSIEGLVPKIVVEKLQEKL